MEVKSKQVILHIPTTCINGWNSVGSRLDYDSIVWICTYDMLCVYVCSYMSRLNVYFDSIQCISLDICEMEEVEDVIGMVEARLQSVSPHANKVHVCIWMAYVCVTKFVDEPCGWILLRWK